MSRRGWLVVLALVLLLVPLAAQAQPASKIHRIGFLWNASLSLTHHLLEAFRHGLRERGYVESKDLTIEHRYAEGNPDLLPGLAAELVGLKVEIIVTSGSQAIQAVKHATSRFRSSWRSVATRWRRASSPASHARART